MSKTVLLEIPLDLALKIAVEKDFECPRVYQIKVEGLLREQGYGKEVDEERRLYLNNLRTKLQNTLGPEGMGLLDTALSKAKESITNNFKE